ncbi:MAG: MXAN_5187 C-terminal domain-containing protein [Myxococcota bacterium]
MARLKLLPFGVIVLGAGLGFLFLLPSKVSLQVEELATSQAAAASAAMAQKIDQRRIELQRAALEVAGTSPVLSALRPSGNQIEAPGPDKFSVVRFAVSEALPPSLGPTVVAAWVNEAGGIWARGEAEPVIAHEDDELDVMSLAGADPKGVVDEAFGVPYLFVSVPVAVPDRPDQARVYGHVVIGAPLLPQEVAETAAKELKVSAVALVAKGKVVDVGGRKPVAEAATKTLRAGQSAVVERGAVATFGPLALPLATHENLLGGDATLAVATRQKLPDTPYEAVVVVGVDPFMRALAGYQRAALLLCLGMVTLTSLWMFVIGLDRRTLIGRIRRKKKQQAGAQPEESSVVSTAFQVEQPAANVEGFDLIEAAAPVAAAPPPLPPRPVAEEGSDDDSTRSIPRMDLNVPNPDATRVAMVSEDLLQASQSRTALEPEPSSPHLPPPLPSVQPVAPATVSPEEQHFQEVFRDFVATRERCGEPADGLTYGKFVLQLRKNKEALVQKYSCRSVRFHVFVKDGKAALRATPVKEKSA